MKTWAWMALFFSSLSFSNSGLAVVAVANPKCESRFVGKIIQTEEDLVADTPLSKVRVSFGDLQVLEGHVEEGVQVEILKHGPFEVSIGKEYEVALNGGKICDLTAL